MACGRLAFHELLNDNEHIPFHSIRFQFCHSHRNHWSDYKFMHFVSNNACDPELTIQTIAIGTAVKGHKTIEFFLLCSVFLNLPSRREIFI